jgi:iron(III) transport system substrate-binding protein
MTWTRRRFLLATSGGLGLLLAGCGAGSARPSASSAAPSGELNTLIEGARREGRVTYYTANDEQTAKRVADGFRAKYQLDVTVDVVRLVSGTLAQRYAGEAQAGNVVADVLSVADPIFMGEAAGQGWLTPLDGLPALAPWPKDAWTGVTARVTTQPINMAWNTDLVKDNPPKGWQDLLDPRWKGQMLLVDPRNSPAVVGLVSALREAYGDDFLRKLGAQNPRLIDSSTPAAQQVAAGAMSIVAAAVPNATQPLIAQGAPLKDLIPDLTTGSESSAGVSKAAPHPNAARLLFNYLLTVEGQSLLNRNGGASVLPNVPDTMPLPKNYKSVNFKEALAKKDELTALLGIS